MLRAQARDALEVELEAVAGARPGRRRAGAELGEELLEAPGGDDLEDPARLVACVPERVPLPARLEDEVADIGEHDVVAELRAHATLDDVAVLVLVRVPVQRRAQPARRDRVLDKREASAGLGAPDHESHAEGGEVDTRAVGGADEAGSLACIEARALCVQVHGRPFG